jgi:hypothetical protein
MPDFEGPDFELAASISLEDQLCPPILNERADWVHRLREAIADKISSLVPQIERVLGLEEPSSAFRYDLSEAILLCALTHFYPPERWSRTAKKLKAISKDAAAAEKNARRLMSRLENDCGIYPPIKNGYLCKLRQHVSDYASLSTLADAHTARKDPGGQTGLVAFRTLVDRLIPAFESATGIRAPVTYNDTTEMYGGQFLEFMYAVVEMVRRLFPSISYPSSGLAVAVFVYKRVTSFRRKSHKGAKRKRGLARGLRLVRSPIRSAPTAGPAKAQKSDIAT